MLLLTGPAGSGKTFRVLERFRAAVRRGDAAVRLLTPTATMAQHLQNQMAREGFVFRPGLIQTLSRFVDPFAADFPQVSDPLFYLIVEEAARHVNRPEFAPVVRLPGFCAALARTMEEFSSAGCDASRLADAFARNGCAAPLGEAFLAVYREVDRELARRGLAARSQRLFRAAQHIATEGLSAIHTVWLDGFYALPDPELAVIEAICRHADVTLTLPAAEVTGPTRARLLAMGFEEEVCRRACVPPRIELCEAPAIEREADEIARRILEQSSAGRPFREMGVIVRSPEIYEPVLRATLDRFGIPARFYFDADLSRHPLVRFLAGAVDAMLGGWDHAETLAALRLAPGTPSDDFDFKVRERMPGAGLASLQRIAAGAPPPLRQLLDSFARLEDWRPLSLLPAHWAARLQGLREMFRPGWPEPAGYEDAAVWRGRAAALDLFDGAMEEAARALPDAPLPLPAFWRAAKSVLRLTPLRIDDRRRNVVHVLGAHEARQWRLPMVFVCGLVEKQFPKFHTQDPFFPEAARAQLKQAGIRLRTAPDFEAEERFLFDWAVTRATEVLTLSYPRSDPRGQPNLRSLFLDGVAAASSAWQPARPAPGRPVALPPPPRIGSPDLLHALSLQHGVFHPTALETYLQCAFQFFGRHTLSLEKAPVRPEDRLNFMTEGNIVHGVLAELFRNSRPLDELFDSVFRRVCERERIPPGYRTEACRERLLADLRHFLADTKWPPGFDKRTEQEFQFPLADSVEIKGRIDRLDVAPDGRSFVIDYKYSRAQNTKNRLEGGNYLQPQLYLLAAERVFDLRAAGMFYCGLRGGVQWAGWSEDAEVPGKPFPPDWLLQATETALRAAAEIRAGRVEPLPADPEQCPRCDFRDVCRFQAAAAAAVEGA
jgi:RecB family exonuclease